MKLPEWFPSAVDLRLSAGFLARLPRFLHNRITPEQAKWIISERMHTREQRFLSIVKKLIFDYEHSPYLQLMKYAGIESGDVKELLSREGLEGTLAKLLEAGIYLSVEEFKGRSEVVRGSQVIKTNPLNLRNPGSEFHIPVHSGGSRSGKGTPLLIDLAYVSDCAVNTCYLFHLHGGNRWLKSDWERVSI
jgi:hypothetical protein